MFLRILGLLFLQALATLVSSSPVVEGFNKDVVVNLRIEGAARTIFERRITTHGHNVTTQSGGTHHCDGTNNKENPRPGATATTALDDASHQGRFNWDGTFFSEFDDYLVTRIDHDLQTQTRFWLLFVNFTLAEVGGCQQKVTRNDDILWAFGSFSDALLKLTGPATARKGHPIVVTVTDGASGQPVAGASVGGKTTGTDGKASLTLKRIGSQRLKAEHPQSIRSNVLEVHVEP